MKKNRQIIPILAAIPALLATHASLATDLTQCYAENFSGNGNLNFSWTTLAATGYTPQTVLVNKQPRLRLTDTGNNEVGGVSKTFPVPTSGKTVYVFESYAYGGSGADGIGVIFSDFSVTPSLAASGGALGYAKTTSQSAFAGAWLGVGIDEYGNFASTDKGMSAGPGRSPNTVTIRGATTTDTPWLYTTPTLSPTINSNSTGHLYRVTLDAQSASLVYLTVERDTSGTGNSYTTLVDSLNIYSKNPSQLPLPGQLRMSLSSSTGGSTNYHEIREISVTGTNCDSIKSVSVDTNNATISNGTATFNLTLSQPVPTGETLTVAYTTRDGTALAGSQYTAAASTVTFAAGESTKQVSVPLLAQTTADNGKVFYLEATAVTPSNSADPYYLGNGISTAQLPDLQAPVATASSITVDQDSQANLVTVLTHVTDPNNQALSVTAAAALHGSVSVNADGSLSYSPTAAYYGTDTITYQVKDTGGASTTGTVNVTVKQVLHAPTTTDASITVAEDSSNNVVNVLANVTDPNGETVTVTSAGADHGTVTINSDGTLNYSPTALVYGADTMTYVVTNSAGLSTTGTVNVTITQVTHTPKFVNNAGIPITNTQATVTEDASTSGSIQTWNPDGTSLSYVVTSQPAHGSVTIDAATGKWTYTPSARYSGADTFTIGLSNGSVVSSLNVQVTVANAESSLKTSGGGSTSLPVLGVLGLFGLARRSRRLSALLTGVLALFGLNAQAETTNGLYLNAGLGQAKTQNSLSKLDQNYTSSGADAYSIKSDNEDLSWRLGAGYRLNRYFAVETNWLDLGKRSVNFNGVTSHAGFYDQVKKVYPLAAKGVSVGAQIGFEPIDNLTVSAKGGVYFWNADYQTDQSGNAVASHDQHGISGFYGAELAYQLSPSWQVYLDAQRFNLAGQKNDLIGGGLRWTFGGLAMPASQPTPAVAPAHIDAPSQPSPAEPVKVMASELNAPLVIYFANDKAEISSADQAQLQKLAQVVGSKTVTIAGYASAVGSQQHNAQLSAKRAQAVANVLRHAGLAAKQIQVEANGAALAGANRQADEGLFRRVDIRW